jgi:hypothetical protein
MEMHMVHVEDNFISGDGTIDLTAAVADAHGLSILAVLFEVDNNKPQVCLNVKLHFSLNM